MLSQKQRRSLSSTIWYALGCDTSSQFREDQSWGAEGAPWQREALPAAEGGAKRRPDRPTAREALRADVSTKNVSGSNTIAQSTATECRWRVDGTHAGAFQIIKNRYKEGV